jgi:hypothetical protein
VRAPYSDWPALTKWTLPWLRAKFGKYDIEVHANRSPNPRCEQHFRRNCSMMKFGDFVDILEGPRETNDIYLVGRNLLMERPEFRGMLEDIQILMVFLILKRRTT